MKKQSKYIPPKSKQICETCKHWHKYGGGCASPGGNCGSGMYYPIYINKIRTTHSPRGQKGAGNETGNRN